MGCAASHHIISFLFFPLCWMAIGDPHAKLWKQQHLAPWQILQAVFLPAFKLCLGLLHGLAADGLSGLPCASGFQFWLTFDSEDFTHFYSFANMGPSKCLMKPILRLRIKCEKHTRRLPFCHSTGQRNRTKSSRAVNLVPPLIYLRLKIEGSYF